MIVSETYDIVDAKYYASNSRIETEGQDYNGQRKIFLSSYEVSYDDVIHFKLGNTIPYHLELGISNQNYVNDVLVVKDGSTVKLHRSILSTETLSYSFTGGTDFSMKPVDTSPNDRIYLYNNGTELTWYQIQLSGKKIRADKYYSYPYTIEIIVL